uniref:Uncharacterized protein n=1 Tax=Arion vulgaris TaxID=1028688 RepID=A0A0B7ARN7_9EUPU
MHYVLKNSTVNMKMMVDVLQNCPLQVEMRQRIGYTHPPPSNRSCIVELEQTIS